jgi:hypothetical protein
MARQRIHGENPADPDRCLCGEEYPRQCRGGIPILRAETGQRIRSLAAQGVPFPQIAARADVSVGTVRRVVHGT